MWLKKRVKAPKIDVVYMSSTLGAGLVSAVSLCLSVWWVSSAAGDDVEYVNICNVVGRGKCADHATSGICAIFPATGCVNLNLNKHGVSRGNSECYRVDCGWGSVNVIVYDASNRVSTNSSGAGSNISISWQGYVQKSV